MLRVAVIGTGYMGRRHLDGYRRVAGVEIVGGACFSAETRDRIAAQYDIPVYLDYRELLAATTPDAVSVCAPTPLHREIALAALSAGVHALVEKPFAETDAEAEEIITAGRGLTLMAAHTDLYDGSILKLATLVSRGYTGAVKSVEYRKTGADISQGDIEKGIVEREMESPTETFDRLYNLLIHISYVTDKLAGGAPAAVRTTTESAMRYREKLRSEIDYDNGARAEILMDGTAPGGLEKIIAVTGDEGRAVWTLRNGRTALSLITPTGERKIQTAPSSPFDNVVKYFAEFVVKGIPPFTPGEDGLKIMRLARRIIEAHS